ncbi:GNAT family N-acetyltransferase [Acidipropionibacterium timonense]|uniref:GNAT family N-acetyltransferase n=1 Tax=Acidipropionibacterium timonense TaxID=2161818 RepID=UPI001FDA72E1|nr:GNAT family N-acetyltransferase [Acidipropionibacterium timonense]
MSTLIRDMRAEDIPAMTALYNSAAVRTTSSYALVEATVDQRTAWWTDLVAQGRPVLVAEIDGEPVGYACHHQFRDLPGYDPTAETSIWLCDEVRGQGVGTALMAELTARARAAAIHCFVAVIDADNEASLRFHARLGFREVGRIPQAARKFDSWREVVLYQLVLD